MCDTGTIHNRISFDPGSYSISRCCRPHFSDEETEVRGVSERHELRAWDSPCPSHSSVPGEVPRNLSVKGQPAWSVDFYSGSFLPASCRDRCGRKVVLKTECAGPMLMQAGGHPAAGAATGTQGPRWETTRMKGVAQRQARSPRGYSSSRGCCHWEQGLAGGNPGGT